jgi:hypothetical protein
MRPSTAELGRENMVKADWFILIEQWVKTGRGDLGLTLPYIVGAIAFKKKQTNLSVEFVKNILDEIAYNPVEGYFTEVRWCSNINAPVFNTRENSWPYKLASPVEIARPSGEGKSIVFSKDMQSGLHFNTSEPKTLLKCLVQHAAEPVFQGKFARCRSENGTRFEFREFSKADIEFIQRSIITPNQ